MERQPLPTALPRPAFLVARARDHGVPRHRLRALDLRAAHTGVRATGEPPSTLDARCTEALPLLTAGHCFSHVTAARLWGLPVPLGATLDGSPLHVTSIGGAREPRRPGIVGHRSTDVLIVRHLDLPVVSPVRAWAQCAGDFGVDDLVVMGDALLSKWSPYPPARYRHLRDLATVVDRWTGRRGATKLREALTLVRHHVWSPKETEVRLFVRRAGRREPPLLNQRMYGRDGAYLGRPDLADESVKVGIEYEGDHHRSSASTFRRDITRRERFADAGWRIIRVTEADLIEAADLRARFCRYLPAAE